MTDQSRAQYSLDGTILLLGPHEPATDPEIRAELPPKSTVDKLVTKFLKGDDSCISILHGPTIQQQLAKHWQDPSRTSLQWLGLLYAILSLSMRMYEREGGAPPEFQGTSDIRLGFPHADDEPQDARLLSVMSIASGRCSASSIRTTPSPRTAPSTHLCSTPILSLAVASTLTWPCGPCWA